MKRYDERRPTVFICGVVLALGFSGCDVVNQSLSGDQETGTPSRTVPVQQLSPSPLAEGIYSGEIACDSSFTSSLFGELSNASATGPLTIIVGPNGIPVREPRGEQNLAGLVFDRLDQGIVVNSDSVKVASTIGFVFGDVALDGASTLAIGASDDGSLQIAIGVLTIGVDKGEVFTLKDDCVGTIALTTSLPAVEMP